MPPYSDSGQKGNGGATNNTEPFQPNAPVPILSPRTVPSTRSSTASLSSSNSNNMPDAAAASSTLNPMTNVSPIDIVVALFDYTPSSASNSGKVRKNHLQLQQGDTIYVLNKNESGWWDGLLIDPNGKVNRGWFPQTYSRSLRNSQQQSVLSSVAKRRASRIRQNLSTQSSRRGSSQLQPYSQLSPTQRKLSVSASSPSRHSHVGQTHSQAQQHASHSPFDSSFCSGSVSSTNSISHSNTTSCNDSQQQNRTFSEAPSTSQMKSVSSSGPPSSAGSQAGSRSLSNPRYSKKQHYQQQQQIDENDGEKINLLSLEEIEMIFSSLHTEIPPIWSPIPTSNLDKIVYYNKHFDIYCNQLPLISNPTLDTTSSFRTEDQAVDLSPRNLQNSSKHNDKTFKIIPYSNKGGTTTSKRSSLSSSSQNYHSPSVSMGNRSGSTSTSNSICYRVASETINSTFSQQQPSASKNVPLKHYSAPNVGMESLSSSATKKKHPSIPHQHIQTERQAILSKPDLFYHHTMDIKLWSELRDTTFYYIRKAHEMLLKNNRLEYEKFFQLVSTYSMYTQIACRLSYSQIKEKNRMKEIKKLLKRIIFSLSRIGINSSIYFASSQRSPSTITSTPRLSEASTESEDVGEKNNPLRQMPSSTDTETLVAGTNNNPSTVNFNTSLSNNEQFSASYYAAQRNNSATTTRTSIPSLHDRSTINLESSAMVRELFDTLDTEFDHFARTMQLIYEVLQTSIVTNDWIPQLFPRFFRGSFNGGSWTNPFSQCGQTLNEDNDPTQGSLIGGLPPKVSKAIAMASGCNTHYFSDLNPDLISETSNSRDKYSPPAHRSGPCCGLNRPSHHRTFSRSKASRSIQYPLNENTINMMKKRYSSLWDKLSSIVVANENLKSLEIINSKKRQLELTSQTYEEVSSCVLLEVLENLDVTIFVNLRTLIATKKNLDAESEEFLRHALSSISSVLTEFFDIKQAFHDTVIRLIMCAQQITLDDPFVFCPMKSNFPVGYFEPGLNLSQSQFNKVDKTAVELYKSLVTQDVEINDMHFLKASEEFADACNKYIEIANISCTIVEQLVEERENLLNYAARMMKNDLTTELLKGEQERWFEDYDVFEPEEEEAGQYEVTHKEDEEHQGDYTVGKSENIVKLDIAGKDTPWFLRSEFDSSLIYDQRGRIKGGTRDALIEHLTSHEVVDAWFNVSMLLTFRSIFTTREFLYSLVYRYNLYPPEGLSYDEYNLWVEKKLTPIKCRVVSIMKSLFSQYWTPAYYEPGISATLNFAQFALSENLPGAQELYEEIKEHLATKGKPRLADPDFADFQNPGVLPDSAKSSPPNLVAGSSSSSIFRLKKFKLLDIDPRTYATQLTIMEHDFYLRISVFECLDRAWGPKYCDMGGSANITKFIASANNLTNYVSHAIVKQTEVKKRARLIQYFITVAQYCREFNNFSSMTAIVSALCSSPIYRLKKTWPLVSTGCTEILKALNTLMDSAKNFIHYRELLRSVKDVACVPFFGVYLSDLTFTFGGNPEFLHNSSDIINFGKRARIVDILEEIMSFKRIHYKLKRYDDIQAIIEGSLEDVPHIEKQYELSLLIEPRGDDQNRSAAADAIKGSGFDPTTEDRNRVSKFGKKKQSSRLFG